MFSPLDLKNEHSDNKTFSSSLRDIILEQNKNDHANRKLLFLSFCSVGFKKVKQELRFSTYSSELIYFIESVLKVEYDGKAEIVKNKKMIHCKIRDKRMVESIIADIDQFFRYNPSSLSDLYNREEYYDIIKTILGGLFLGCGFLANPRERYHLEFAIPKRSVSLWYGLFLSELELEPGRTLHQGSEVLYIKEGERIADFLRYLRADALLLHFEQVRVEKELRNRVNRIVNCDSANAQRLANSVTRQIANIKYIEETIGLSELTKDLRKTAELRLKFPEYSLKELGEEADPPLGKSGINHRLKKIDEIAEKLRNKN